MVLRRSLRCRCCLQCRGGAAAAVLCRGGAGVVVPVLRRDPRHGGDAVQRRCGAVARRGGDAALAVLLLWRCCAVACRGVAAAVTVLWPAVAVLLPWLCCCSGGAAAVAVLRRGLPWRCCCSGCAVPWPAVAVLRCGRQWPCCAVACSGGAALCPVESAFPTVAVLRRGVQWRVLCGSSRSERMSVSSSVACPNA